MGCAAGLNIVITSIGKDLIEENEREARRLRSIYDEAGMKVYEFLGGPGSGKTSVIERLLEFMLQEYRPEEVGYIGGDVATSLDAERIARYGVRHVQINTGGICHLEAHHIETALMFLDKGKGLKVLIIENVGNLICPFNFPLGAHARVLVADVTEGEDKFVKHPLSTRVSDIIVINKVDLAPVMGVNVERMVKDARKLNPKAPIILASARTGKGIRELYEALKAAPFPEEEEEEVIVLR